MIARLWFNTLFPPPLIEETNTIGDTNFMYTTFRPDVLQEAVFQVMMTVATSLALGLLLGFGVVQLGRFVLEKLFCGMSFCHPTAREDLAAVSSLVERRQEREGVLSAIPEEEDPMDDVGDDIQSFSIPQAASEQLDNDNEPNYSTEESAKVTWQET